MSKKRKLPTLEEFTRRVRCKDFMAVGFFYFVYILRTSSNTLYIGQTNNLEKRLSEHKNKTSKSAKYIKYFSSCQLVYSEEYPTRIEAMKREYQLKKWTKAKKEALIKDNLHEFRT